MTDEAAQLMVAVEVATARKKMWAAARDAEAAAKVAYGEALVALAKARNAAMRSELTEVSV